MALPDAEILDITRKAIGKTMLAALDERQTLEFYRMTKQLYQSSSTRPWDTLTRLILAWNVISDPNRDTLYMAVRTVGRRLFRWDKLQKPLVPYTYPSKPAALQKFEASQREKPAAVAAPVTEVEIKSKFDPLNETIELIQALKEDYTFFRGIARAAGMLDENVIKLAAALRLSIKDAWEAFQALELFDPETLSNMQSKVHIGTMNLLIQQNVTNPENIGNALALFESELQALAHGGNLPQIESEILDATFSAADGESGSGPPDSLQSDESAWADPIGDPFSRDLPPDTPPRSE